ncbi:MAG: retropepsin-like aspartic protease, partial [Pseudomonadota bacterium]
MKTLLLGLSAILLSWAAPAAADCVTSAQASPDSAGRAVAMVFVNNQGPFRFVVDTGASRSVLSSELAEHLGLRIFGQSEVHSVTDVRLAPLAHVASLHFGPVALANTDLPVLDGPMLAGEQGMLGF